MHVTGSSIQQIETDKPKKKCRKWRLWLNVEELDKRPSKYVTGRYMDATDALKAFVEEYENKSTPAGEFGRYVESWRAYRVKSGELAPGTLANDKRNVNALRRSQLWNMELTQIKPNDCRDALMWIKEHPARVETLTNTSMNKIYQTLNIIMGQAWDDGLIPSNPMSRVKAPKPDTKEKEALTPAELDELLDKLDSLPLDGRVLAVYCICIAGLRRSEACALEPSDIGHGLLNVDKAVKERDGSISAPKTPAGVRTVPIPQRLEDKALEWLSMRPMGAKTLCCNTRGGILRPQLLQRWWTGDSAHNGVSVSLGLEGVTLHQLRHSNLSMMARHMSPFDLKTYAGWSSIEPAKVYIHDDLDSLKSSVERAWE